MPAFKDSLARITDIGAFTDGIPLKAACCRSPMPHLGSFAGEGEILR